MFKNGTWLTTSLLISSFFLIPSLQALENTDEKAFITGGGHVGLFEAYTFYTQKQLEGKNVRVKICDKNASIHKTTAANIWNSHTPDEIIAVVPRGDELTEKLKIPFDEPGGIGVKENGVNTSECTEHFIQEVTAFGKNTTIYQIQTNLSIQVGKAGMLLWKDFFETADESLKDILKQSYFNPCCEVNEGEAQLHKGYRIDLLYDIPQAHSRAESMIKSYNQLGYNECRILSPDEVISRDTGLTQFCDAYSLGKIGERYWKEGSLALWRPGGCLDTQTFLPLFVNYLEKKMGTYISKKGKEKNRFQMLFNKKVTEVVFEENTINGKIIKGLKFGDGSHTSMVPSLKKNYIFCPGEAVGTLHSLGFQEPAYAGFAGASLYLNIPLNNQQLKEFQDFNHCMEVHKTGIVLAWQARVRDNSLFLGAAGTKAYYGDQTPTINQEFALNRNMVQLNMFNEVLPQIVTLALNEDTTEMELTEHHMKRLENKGIAHRWVGVRAVAYDGYFTLGKIYHHDGRVISNGRCTTHLGSGGGSFALIASLLSYASLNSTAQKTLEEVGIGLPMTQEILKYADSRRSSDKLENFSN